MRGAVVATAIYLPIITLATPALTQAMEDASQAATSDKGTTQRAELEEIVVTALKRETNIQDTPLAITAVTGNTLNAMGVSDIASLNRVSPGLFVRPSSFSGSRLTSRNLTAPD